MGKQKYSKVMVSYIFSMKQKYMQFFQDMGIGKSSSTGSVGKNKK